MAWTWRLAAALAVCGTVMGLARPAEACSPPPELAIFPQLGSALEDVPTDGVIAFRADVYGDMAAALELLTIEVTLDGLAVEGAIETIELGEGEAHDIIVVWRPAAPFVASSSYEATITTADPWTPEGEPIVNTLAVNTGASAAGGSLDASLGALELTAVSGQTGPRVCCDQDSCGFANCAAPDMEDRPTVAADVNGGRGPLLSQMYLRAFGGFEGELEELSVLGIAALVEGVTIQRTFDAAGDRYCMRLDAVSLIDGAVVEGEVSCIDHGDLQLGSGPNPDFEAFLDSCTEAPYWEDTNEPYIPDAEESSGSDSEGSGSEGSGSEGSGSEGGDESGDETGGAENDASGCACNVDTRGSIAPALALFVLGLLRRRRR